MKLQTLPGVFPPRSDSWVLADTVGAEPLGGGRSLDLCTGSGIAAVAAAMVGAEATAVDVSRRALACAWYNARRNGTRVRVRHGNLFEPVGAERFDLISVNPPYVPCGSDQLPDRGPQRAWEAGLDGRTLLDEICDHAIDHLRPHGALLVVHSALIGEEETLHRLAASGLDPAVVVRRRGPLGPLMRAQQRAGRIPSTVDHEDVVIIRGVRRT
ncbi:MAG TPA: HemK2/MTQ2 family protein methyltransferase [Acidimicrobiales bacterium]|nr:HemK2/MTQ2 family protein methyltransferase [Acidimicrobiales bacterium]